MANRKYDKAKNSNREIVAVGKQNKKFINRSWNGHLIGGHLKVVVAVAEETAYELNGG